MESIRQEGAAGSALTLPSGGDGTNPRWAMASIPCYTMDGQSASALFPTEILHRVYLYILSWPVEGGAP